MTRHAAGRLYRSAWSAIPLLLLAIALSGCMRVARALQVNSDGSGEYALTLGFREPTAGDPTTVATQVTGPMNAFATHVEQTGGTVRQYSDATYEYWSFTRPFATLAAGDALLQDTPQRYDANHIPLLYRDTLHIRRETSAFASVIRITGTISLVDALNNAQAWTDATETLTITMGGGISAYSGGTRDGDSVTYRIGYNQSAKVDVSGDAESTLAPFSPLAVGLGLLGIALALLGLLLVARAARARR